MVQPHVTLPKTSPPQTSPPQRDLDDPLVGFREDDYEPPEKSEPDPGEEPAAGNVSLPDGVQAPQSSIDPSSEKD